MPSPVAVHAASFATWRRGRFIFGIARRTLACDAEALGVLGEDRDKVCADAIEMTLASWEREPLRTR